MTVSDMLMMPATGSANGQALNSDPVQANSNTTAPAHASASTPKDLVIALAVLLGLYYGVHIFERVI